ncbi:type III secretion system protein [Vibrio cholerae]|uniref:type III secretion system protein n=1 Tax=Vibrio cholerae TaxID=666 RepID=UPI00226D8290|nr:type III secretion system protein [Vibrio cholerae]MCX9560022.1 type III secretion system protein [Vibrio cholerae]MCX9561015.1 type III secretion system protein [Vibrio cholerae]
MTTVINFASQPSAITFAEESHAQQTVMVDVNELNHKLITCAKQLNEIKDGPVLMSELLALLAEIIKSNRSLYEQLTTNRTSEALATCKLAMKIANDKESAEVKKFAIGLATSVATMAITTCSAVKSGQCKTLKDKHLTDLTTGQQGSVRSLDARTLNKKTSDLNESRLAKYRATAQAAEMGGNMVGNVKDMEHANDVCEQEKTQANKELKVKLDQQIDQFIANLEEGHSKLTELLNSANQASSPNNR